MEAKQVGQVRRAISRTKNAGRLRYSKFVRQSAIDWLSQGDSPSAIAEATGIGLPTVMRWARLGDDNFRRVDVIQKNEPSSVGPITVEFANGVRLTCPTVDMLTEVLEYFK